MNKVKYDIVDTRPYAAHGHKNSLLHYAGWILSASPEFIPQLAQSLHDSIAELLDKRRDLPLSVALSLAPSREHYRILLQALNEVLVAQQADEYQWVVMPLVMVLGSVEPKRIFLEIPRESYLSMLNNTYSEAIGKVTWLDRIVLVDQFAKLKAHEWYFAKKDPNIILELLAKGEKSLDLAVGHHIELGFVVGYTLEKIHALFQSEQNRLLVMQFWNEYFLKQEITPFINPLSLNSPIQGLLEGSLFRKKMALDIFVSNTIRNLKLAGYSIATVIGTKQGGVLEIRIQALEDGSKFAIHGWQLTSADELSKIIDNLLDCLKSCLLKNIWLLKKPLEADETLPDYHQAVSLSGSDPLTIDE